MKTSKTATKTKPVKAPVNLTLDYRSTAPVPVWVRDIIETHLAIEAEDAKSAGSIGFMSRALVIATMPYKDPKTDSFYRQNGDFRLRIVAGYEGGIPYGIYPRLLMSWVATEAVRRQSPIIELGDSLGSFLRDVINVQRGGGKLGPNVRVTEQMKRLFGSLVTAQYTGTQEHRGFLLKNILIADELEIHNAEMDSLWTPQETHEAGIWKSKVRLSNSFFNECISTPVPIDLRAYKSLRGSPLAMDVYAWLTFRMSYIQKKSHPIPWLSLMGQFGSGFNINDIEQAVRNFKKAFITALKLVLIIYPAAKVEVANEGLILHPSPTHIPFKTSQPSLF